MEDKNSQEVFEINDFFNATPWEKFIDEIENFLEKWGLNNHRQGNPEFFTKLPFIISQNFFYNNDEYILEYQIIASEENSRGFSLPAMSQLLSKKRDHTIPYSHPITKIFGILNFLILYPTNQYQHNQEQDSLLLSSLCLAASNCRCCVPLFVPRDSSCHLPFQHQRHYNHNQTLYSGRLGYKSLSLRFENLVLTKTPPDLRHLSSLEDYFQDNILFRRLKPDGHIMICVSYTFSLSSSLFSLWEPLPRIFLDLSVCSKNEDPISSLILVTKWSYFPKGSFIDNAIYTDLDALTAPIWNLSVDWTSSAACFLHTPLSMNLRSFLRLCYSGIQAREMNSCLDERSHCSSNFIDITIRNIFNSQTNPIFKYEITNSALLSLYDFNLKKSCPFNSLLSHLALSYLSFLSSPLTLSGIFEIYKEFVAELRFLWENLIEIPFVDISTRSQNKNDIIDLNSCLLNQKLQLLSHCILTKTNIKSNALKNQMDQSISSTISQSIDIDDHSLNESVNLSFWGGTNLIPVDAEGHDNFDDQVIESKDSSSTQSFLPPTPVLSQPPVKSNTSSSSLQDRRARFRQRIQQSRNNNSSNSESENDENENESEKEEIDDIKEHLHPPSVSAHISSQKPSTITTISKLTDRPPPDLPPPQGVDHILPDLFLLENHQPLRVPICQDPIIQTEDVIIQQQEILEKLGNSPEASQLRAQFQSAGLLSDMEAFKAANPGSILADFVRWYSPNDWIENDKTSQSGVSGYLSARMNNPNNIWERLWCQAKHCPVSQQQPLFDCDKEAELALHYLETIPPSSFLSQILNISVNVVNHILIIASSKCCTSQFLLDAHQQLHSSSSQLPQPSQACFHQQTLLESTEHYFASCQTFLNEIAAVELHIGRALSLHKLFPSCSRFIDEILSSNSSTCLHNEREYVLSLFLKQGLGGHSLPNPQSREYSFISNSKSSVDKNSIQTGHRLYIKSSNNQFQIAQAYSELF